MNSQVVQADAQTTIDPAVWPIIPDLLWFLLVCVVLFYLRTEIARFLKAVSQRLKGGSSIKIAALEIGPSSGLVAATGRFKQTESKLGVKADSDGKRSKHRDSVYDECRGAMIVHKIQHSSEDGQIYDILIYIIPHRGSSLASVASVEYFFGKYWGDKIFPSEDRSRGFPVVTSAYGPFLCSAKLHFNDGTTALVSRYVDFEMGGSSPTVSD
jgi:hypothetical protein